MSPLEEVLDEVRLLWHRLVQVGEQLHARAPVTLGMRAVLEFLDRHGPTSVPGIARSRHVTRQHIQALVNGLLQRGLVELLDNPAHRRSRLVALTAEGRRTFGRMRAKEARLLARLNLRVRDADLRQTAATLGAVRHGLGRRPR